MHNPPQRLDTRQPQLVRCRITPNTPVVFNGPVRGSTWLRTAFSADGTQGRGTINNCANGHTLWGTNITCEENWAGYFRRDNSGAGTDNAARTERELVALRRYGVTSNIGNNAWSTVAGSSGTLFRRWDARATGASATDDFRNEPNQFGCVPLPQICCCHSALPCCPVAQESAVPPANHCADEPR